MSLVMADLKVLLIGGSSGVGKTVVAAQIASQLGMTWGQVDDFRLVIERITAPEHQPALHAFFRNFDMLAPEELAQQYAAVARVVSNAIEITRATAAYCCANSSGA